jgi:hypothetical protein
MRVEDREVVGLGGGRRGRGGGDEPEQEDGRDEDRESTMPRHADLPLGLLAGDGSRPGGSFDGREWAAEAVMGL